MKTKHQRARIQIIDRELTKHEFVKTADLHRIIKNESLEVSTRTIQKDIELMKEDRPVGYSAPIEIDTKKKAYYYKDKNFTIQAFGLKTEDVKALLFYEKTLDQVKGIKLFNDVLNAIEKVVDNLQVAKSIKHSIENKSLLLTEKHPIIGGIEFIEPIIKAIVENQKIKFEYKKFDDYGYQEKELSPILLKEDKHFWYVIGYKDGKIQPTTYALDRMARLKVTNNYFKPPNFNATEYFKHSLGITVPECDPVKITLSFTTYQGNYIKALPLHESQKIIKDTKKELRVSIFVKPSYELYSKILGYGENVKVISPKLIVDEMKHRINALYRSYH